MKELVHIVQVQIFGGHRFRRRGWRLILELVQMVQCWWLSNCCWCIICTDYQRWWYSGWSGWFRGEETCSVRSWSAFLVLAVKACIYVFSFKVCGHRKVNQMLAMWRDRLHREQVDNLVMLNMHKRQAGADASDWLCPNLLCPDQTYCNADVICFRWVLFIQCFVFTSWFHY